MTRRRAGAAGFLVVLVAVMAGGCGTGDADTRSETAGLPSTIDDIAAESWVLDRSDSSLAATSDQPITLSVEDGTVFGTAGCNSYRGSMEVDDDDDSVEISGIAATAMACEEDVMAAETEFLTALEAVDRVEVDPDRLVLRDGSGVRLSFSSYDHRELLVGSWTVVDVASGDAIRGVIDGTEPGLGFEDDGTLLVRGGCNNGRSTWELRDDEISIGPIGVTKKMCAVPDGVMEQEAALLAALEATARADVAPGKLVLLHDDGRILVVAVPRT